MFTKKDIKKFLQTKSPDTFYNNKPLVVWCLENPKALKLLLKNGADPNIDFEISDGISVTPSFVAKHLIKRLNVLLTSLEDIGYMECYYGTEKSLERLKKSRNLLKSFGGKSLLFREYIRVDVHV